MNAVARLPRPGVIASMVLATALLVHLRPLAAQQMATETRDPRQEQDVEFSKRYQEWTGETHFGSPLVDHLPVVHGVPSPRDVLGYDIGAPRKLTYYADMLRYYRALAKATPRVRVETIGRSDEGRELVVVWVSSDENMRRLDGNRHNLARLADPRGLTPEQVRELIATTRPDYHLLGGLHSGETGPSEMLMELVYRIATETSPLITQIRNNVYLSVTPVADADGRDRNVDWFYHGLDPAPKALTAAVAPGDSAKGKHVTVAADSAAPATGAAPGGGRAGLGIGSLPYWGKYVYHDNNRDINLSLRQIRSLADWYYTAHPPIMHDLHESLTLMYTYSGGPPQNPNLDPLLFAELPWFSNFELAQMTKWGMPGVYDHAFMDGWSPGYLGSIAYNHNGMMKMYETQTGRDPDTASAKPPAPASATKDSTAKRAAGDSTAKPARDSTSRASSDSIPRPGSRPAPAPRTPPPGGAGLIPSGVGGEQPREWYRGLPVPADAVAHFTRRDNTNYMETGVLSALQLASMFPNVVVENFYIKTRNAIEDGRTKPPFGFVIPVQRDMTRAAELVNTLRIQGIEVGVATSSFKIGDSTYRAGSYVIKRDQPYGRLAKNLLEKQVFPDARLSTYDDSGWSMGLAMLVDVDAIADSSIRKVATTPVTRVVLAGTTAGTTGSTMAVAHYGSINMITFRYRLKDVPMRIAEKEFTQDSVRYPAGSFIITDTTAFTIARQAVRDLGLTAAMMTAPPSVASHDANVPRVAIYSQWSNTQDLGWYRLAFDKLQIPYDLIFKEQIAGVPLKQRYDVVLMAQQNISRQAVMATKAARAQPYQKSDKYQFLGMYGETADMSGGFGQAGVDAFAAFLDQGGTLITAGTAARFPIDFGWAHTVDTDPVPGLTSERPLVQAEITSSAHPVFYGYERKVLPIKYVGGPTLRVGVADQANVLARYVGGNAAVLSGLMVGADSLKLRPFAVDVPHAYQGHGRVILFANNPIYRWQNLGEFNMIFNAIMNWDDQPQAESPPR